MRGVFFVIIILMSYTAYAQPHASNIIRGELDTTVGTPTFWYLSDIDGDEVLDSIPFLGDKVSQYGFQPQATIRLRFYATEGQATIKLYEMFFIRDTTATGFIGQDTVRTDTAWVLLRSCENTTCDSTVSVDDGEEPVTNSFTNGYTGASADVVLEAPYCRNLAFVVTGRVINQRIFYEVVYGQASYLFR